MKRRKRVRPQPSLPAAERRRLDALIDRVLRGEFTWDKVAGARLQASRRRAVRP